MVFQQRLFPFQVVAVGSPHTSDAAGLAGETGAAGALCASLLTQISRISAPSCCHPPTFFSFLKTVAPVSVSLSSPSPSAILDDISIHRAPVQFLGLPVSGLPCLPCPPPPQPLVPQSPSCLVVISDVTDSSILLPSNVLIQLLSPIPPCALIRTSSSRTPLLSNCLSLIQHRIPGSSFLDNALSSPILSISFTEFHS